MAVRRRSTSSSLDGLRTSTSPSSTTISTEVNDNVASSPSGEGLSTATFSTTSGGEVYVTITTTVAPSQTHNSNGIPKIDGSEGGFIGLVVALGVLFLGCCVAVFYLLYTRPHGGRRSGRVASATGKDARPGNTTVGGDVETAFPDRGHRGTLFGFRANSGPKRTGWMQATGGGSEEDEWDAREAGFDPSAVALAGGALGSAKAKGYDHARGESETSELSGGGGVMGPMMSESANSSLSAIRRDSGSRPASTLPTHPHRMEPERAFSVESISTFEGGTKFKEHLYDFSS